MRTTTRRLDRPAIRNCFALIATMLLSAPFALALAAQAGELRLSHQWTANQDARDVAARVFAEELQKRLPQQRVTIHSSSSLVANPVEQYDAMLDGRIEMAIFPLFYIAPKVPEVSITLMPGVPSSVEQARLLKGSEFQTKFQDFCEQKGFHVLGWWWLAGGIVSREADIGAPASYKSLMVRSGDPNFDLMFQAAGAKSKVLSSPKIAASLKEGSLDVALASLELLVSLKIFEVLEARPDRRRHSLCVAAPADDLDQGVEPAQRCGEARLRGCRRGGGGSVRAQPGSSRETDGRYLHQGRCPGAADDEGRIRGLARDRQQDLVAQLSRHEFDQPRAVRRHADELHQSGEALV